MSYQKIKEWFGSPGWFRCSKEQEQEDPQRLILAETQSLKKLCRKQGMLLEEVHREQKNAAVTAKKPDLQPLIDLCDALFYLQRAFRNPGLMSREHAQVLNMVHQRMIRFALAFGIEMIVTEGTPFDPRMHQAVTNTAPDACQLDVLEVIQPGYLKDGQVLRAARVIVGKPAEEIFFTTEGTKTS